MKDHFGDPIYFSRSYGCYLTNMAIGEVYRIDFVNMAGCKYPPGSIINIPGQAVNNIYIRNDGAATVQYSINDGDIHTIIGGVIPPTVIRDPKSPITNLKSVNFYVMSVGNTLFANVSVEVLV